LEWSCRLASADQTGQALADYSRALAAIEPRYFTLLPKPCAGSRDFELPSSAAQPDSDRPRQLLWALFDLVRNGQAHQYQQIIVELNDGQEFEVGLSGTRFGRWLWRPHARSVKNVHLGLRTGMNGRVELVVRPDVLFTHLTAAIDRARLLSRGLTFDYLKRPKPNSAQPRIPGPFYDFDAPSLLSALADGGHPRVESNSAFHQ
ncbi:MAG TPA: hypothetical protein VEZ14_13420, partial [Dehalococcoidia bacterium]|nr:hypothetical protein [Dehalococcoidia bacterium]